MSDITELLRDVEQHLEATKYRLGQDGLNESKNLLSRVRDALAEREKPDSTTIRNLRMRCFEQNEKIMSLNRKMLELENVARLAVESQGWDGNNDCRWEDFYHKAKESLNPITAQESVAEREPKMRIIKQHTQYEPTEEPQGGRVR